MTTYVRYIGLAHARGITRADWRSVGLDGEDVWWDYTNGFSVPADRFTDEQMRKVITPDTSLLVVGMDTEPQPLPHAMTPSQAAMPRVNLNAAVGNETNAGVPDTATDAETASTDVSGASTGTPGGTAPTRRTTGRGSGKDA
mgnify:CR=1 FL=1